jgi:organic radical activating enzyme
MKKSEVLRAWSKILAGRAPSLSIEITKECPLKCPGCYAFDAAHLGGAMQLRDLSDFKGEDLVARVLTLIDEHKPIHVSLVGGDPLVRYREVDALLPQMEKRGVYTQIVTSAFREIPVGWMAFKNLNVVVSIDGLQPEHDARRKPATYDRILKNKIAGRTGYLDEFLQFWTGRPEVERVWFSIFTPQRGAADAEVPTAAQRASVVADLRRLRLKYSALEMPEALIREIESPPASPSECIFARTTKMISADLRSPITPCQFGGDPDCQQCGCIASMALAAVGHHRVMGPLTAGHLLMASERLGKGWKRLSESFSRKSTDPIRSPFRILQP